MSYRMFNSSSPLINIMAKAVFKAAQGLLRDFSEVENLQVSLKGPGDLVSIADKNAEKIIYMMLHTAYPNYNFIMEESGEVLHTQDPDAPCWIVDPLDGTKNFLHGIPHFAISVALKEKGHVLAGIIYDPVKDELFWAQKGKGAFLNDRRIRVSSRKNIEEGLLAFGGPPGHQRDEARRELTIRDSLKKVAGCVSGIRTLGSAALDLAYVASGRFEGFVNIKRLNGILLRECFWPKRLEDL